MSRIILLLFLLFSSPVLFSQVRDSAEIEEDYYEENIETGHYNNMYPADSVLRANPLSENQIYPKKFKENLSSRYKGKDFDYTTHQPQESFFQKLLRKLDALIQAIFGDVNPSGSLGFTTVLLRLFVIIIVGFVLYFLVKFIISRNGNLFFGKRNRKTIINDEDVVENIHEINFPENILKYESMKDYRSAIRYQFLFVLKRMSDKKLINWNFEKTNKDYIQELKASHLQKEFADLAHIFDYVWYGEFSIDEASYTTFKRKFQSFKP